MKRNIFSREKRKREKMFQNEMSGKAEYFKNSVEQYRIGSH